MFVRTVTGRVTPLLTTRPSSLFVIMKMLILTSVDLISQVYYLISFFSIFLSVKMFAFIVFLLRTNSEKVSGCAFVEVIKDEVEGTQDCCHHRLRFPKWMPSCPLFAKSICILSLFAWLTLLP